MATTTIPKLIASSVGESPRLWMYHSTDVHTAVDASAYFTNGYAGGMRNGDLVFVYSSSTFAWTGHTVIVSSGTTTVDLSDGTVIGATANSD